MKYTGEFQPILLTTKQHPVDFLGVHLKYGYYDAFHLYLAVAYTALTSKKKHALFGLSVFFFFFIVSPFLIAGV